MTKTVRLAVIGGDGIGPEVVGEALKVLDVAIAGTDLTFEKTEFKLGAERFLATGDVLPEAEYEAISTHDVILLGAVGGVPGDTRLVNAGIERGLLLRLRFGLDQYVNLRPTVLYPGVESPLKNPGLVDFVVVREATEGSYAGVGGVLRKGTLNEIATEVSVNTRLGVERVVRYAFAAAEQRERKKLTLIHKTNVLGFAGALWKNVVDLIAAEYPKVTVTYEHIDAAMIYMVTDPSRYDVIVTDNIFGDIITDLAGAISGGIGLSSSANLNPERNFPSMFEPAHGSAPDIAGKGIADPTATILSLVLMFEHLGEPGIAARISSAVMDDLSSRMDKLRSTTEIGDEIAARIASR